MLTARVEVNGRPIGDLRILNLTGASDAEEADYSVQLRVAEESHVAPGRILSTRILGFPRRRGAFALISEALDALRLSPGGPHLTQ